VGSNAVNTVPGINSFVNAQQAGFIQQPVWPVTNANVYPNVGTTTGAPVWADTNYYRPPRQNQWSIGIQQEVTHNLVLEGSYVANRQVWVPIGGPGGSGPLAAGNFISPSAYAQYGLYPYPGTGSPGYAYSSPSLAGKCVPGNDCDRFLLTQPVNSAAVIQKMGGLFLPYPSASPTTILQTALRPYPQFPFNNGSTTTVFAPQGSPTGNERYDSLQAKLTKRLSHGLQASGAFTWEKSFLRATRQDFFNASSSQWALQNLPPRVLTFNIVYTTPEVSHFKTHDKWVNQVLKDWQIGWFANYQSGTFLTPPTSNTANFLSSSMTRVPGQPLYLKELNCKCYNPYYDQVLNPAAWRNLPANATGTSTAVLYEDFRGPRHPQENANFGRNFKVNERFTLQFRGEFVNIFNRTIMPNPITNLNPTVPLTRNSLGILTNGFGVVNAYLTPNSQAGTTTSAQPGGAALAPRSGTLVLRLVF
jgi:hypothetical protein